MTRRRKLFLFCFLPIASLLSGVVILGVIGIPAHDLGSRTVAILSGAERVETFRMDSSREVWPKEGTSGDEIVDYPVEYQGKTLGTQFAAKLSQALLDPRALLEPNDSACLIKPAVAFRAWRGQECVEVIICFHCRQMFITTKDAQGHEVRSEYVVIDGMRTDFLALAREAFPDNKEIQSLK